MRLTWTTSFTACVCIASTMFGSNVAAADPPPVQCKLTWQCQLTAEKQAAPRQPIRAVSPQPPVQKCIDATTCELEAGPQDLAQRAVALLPLSGAVIESAPRHGGFGLVGLPVWLWTDQTSRTWGPITRTAAVEGLRVTAQANAQSIAWDMGDGGTVECSTPGTPYTPSYGRHDSPDCGYVYQHASTSRPGGVYTVTATTSWAINWWEVGGTATGTLTTTTQSRTTVAIRELQAVTS